jgi:hypothetical protein
MPRIPAWPVADPPMIVRRLGRRTFGPVTHRGLALAGHRKGPCRQRRVMRRGHAGAPSVL